jgi:hypothetical protein
MADFLPLTRTLDRQAPRPDPNCWEYRHAPQHRPHGNESDPFPSYFLFSLRLAPRVVGTQVSVLQFLYYFPLSVVAIMLEYVLALVGAYVAWSLVCLELNYRRTLSMGVPLIRLPIDPMNIPFQVIEPHLFRVLDFLPVLLIPNCIWYLRRGWFFPDKADTHVRYGPIFAFVTPRGVHVYISDADAIADIFRRRLDFKRPIENYSMSMFCFV